MPNGRQGSHRLNNAADHHDISFVDDLSDDNQSDALVEMDIDNSDLLLNEEGVLGDEDIDERFDDSTGQHSVDFEFEEDSDEGDIDGNLESDVEDDENGNYEFSNQNFQGLFSSHETHPALEALGRLRRLVPSLNGGEDWDDDNGDDRQNGHSSVNGQLGGNIRFPFLEAFGGAVINPRFNEVLRSLRSPSEPEILSGLSELSNLLLMPQGGLGSAFIPIESLARALVDLLRKSEAIEVQVMTARATSQLIDSGFGPGTSKALINAGIIPVLRRTLENVFYIDLIEQLIHVLKPLASAEPQLVLESGCFLPCVSTLDFFNEYIQKEIMAAIDICAKELAPESYEAAKEILAIFPEHPNENVIGTYSSLIIAIAKLNQDDFKEVVTSAMWDNLIQNIQPGTPHIARVIRAVAHTASRCPEMVQNYVFIAELVQYTLIQDTNEDGVDLFGKLISVSKDILFAGLKLLQVLLPLPPAIGNFNGPYRKNSHMNTHNVGDISAFAKTTVPLAMAAYSASTNTPVRQLAILVVMQVVSALSKDEAFVETVRKLGIVNFAGQVISEGADNLVLTVGGLDIVWDLSSNRELLQDLSNIGISGDLEGYIVQDSAEPSGQIAPTDSLQNVASYMSREILDRVRSTSSHSSKEISELVDRVREGNYDSSMLNSAPLPDLLRGGLLEALEVGDIESRLDANMIALLQAAFNRLERFDLQLTGSKAKSIDEVLSRLVYVKLVEASNSSSERTWAVSVSAFATVRSLEHFVRSRLHIQQAFTNSRAQAVNSSNIRFWAGDSKLPRDISVLKAIQGQHGVPVIKYEVVDENVESDEDENTSDNTNTKDAVPEPVATVLRLLRRLALENERLGAPISWDRFQSTKLTAKLSRQLADVLAIAASMLPQWTFDTVHEFPFLYPLKIRLHFVQLTYFGMGRNLRLLRRMQQDGEDDDEDILPDDDESNTVLGRHKHQKFRLSRENILEGAVKLLEISSKNPAVVEVMFYGEEGTGRGPTQEFFALASRALSDMSLDMWTLTSAGLFIKANVDPSTTVLRYFKAMGMLVARALLDKRILDFRLNPAFFEAVLSESGPSVDKLRRVDPSLASSLDKLLDSSAEDLKGIALDFTLPGTSVELLPGGSDIYVTPENVGDYAQLVCDMILGSGIQKQIDAFRSGFSDTIPVSALRSFMLDELVTLCGANDDEDWSLSTLREAFTADHGYHMSSEPVQQLLNILSTFDKEERRRFLMFATGSPHLPVGGFGALNPRFTVVVKHPDNESLSIDQYLPSVMTCANYFKLPAYSSEAVMRHQLKVAMNEGADSFLLS